MRSLTPQEEKLMRFVWKSEKGFIKDFRKMYDVPLPPYTSVATNIKKLEAKGYLTGKRYGNTYEYSPAIEQDEYKKASMSAMVANYFQNSYKDMVTFFAKEENLSEEDLQEIINLIKK
jgi:predicted transcriptional regulator